MLKNELFKQARIRAGYSQVEFAKKLGSNQAYVSALETRSNFSLQTAIELGNILGIDGKTLMVDETGSYKEVDKKQAEKNVLAFLKRNDIKIVDLIKTMKISRTKFYHQIKADDIKQGFKDEFSKATGFNLMNIINEKSF